LRVRRHDARLEDEKVRVIPNVDLLSALHGASEEFVEADAIAGMLRLAGLGD
jgi:hypothetical protein